MKPDETIKFIKNLNGVLSSLNEHHMNKPFVLVNLMMRLIIANKFQKSERETYPTAIKYLNLLIAKYDADLIRGKLTPLIDEVLSEDLPESLKEDIKSLCTGQIIAYHSLPDDDLKNYFRADITWQEFSPVFFRLEKTIRKEKLLEEMLKIFELSYFPDNVNFISGTDGIFYNSYEHEKYSSQYSEFQTDIILKFIGKGIKNRNQQIIRKALVITSNNG